MTSGHPGIYTTLTDTTRGKIGQPLLGAATYREGYTDVREWFAANSDALKHGIDNFLSQVLRDNNPNRATVERLDTAIAALPAINAALDLEKQLGPEDQSILYTIDIAGIYDALSAAKSDMTRSKLAHALSNKNT